MSDHAARQWLAAIIAAARQSDCGACAGHACPDHAAAAVVGEVEKRLAGTIREARAGAFAEAAAELTDWAQFAEVTDPPRGMQWEMWQVKARANRHAAELFADWAAEAMGERWVWTDRGSEAA